MNEIMPKTSVATSSVPRATASSNTPKAAASGNSLPQAAVPTHEKPVEEKDIRANVEAAVKQMNEYIQSTQRDLHFSYDEASGETVVKVLDRSTQKVIRQIPDEIFLKFAQDHDSTGNFQLFKAEA